MSPQSHEDPQLETFATAPPPTSHKTMACPPPPAPPPASGNDNDAANGNTATKGTALPPTTKGVRGCGVPYEPPRPPQTTEAKAVRATLAAGAATGLISPLTLIKEKPNDGKHHHGPGSILKKTLSHRRTPVRHRHGDPSVANTPQVDSYSISKIEQAREKVKRSFDESHLLDKDEYVFPRFEFDELTLGEVLGRGGFGTVLAIKAMEMSHPEPHPEPEPKEDPPPRAPHTRAVSERSVFSVDELHGDDHRKEGRRGRRKSHLRFLRRGHHHHNHDRHGAEGEGDGLKLSNSHDGCEGLMTAGGDDRLRSQSERGPVQISKSFDALDGGGDMLTPTARRDHSAPNTHTGAAEGNRHKKHHRRARSHHSRAMSWTHAKAAAHDVSHFFHKSPRHHHEADGRGFEVALSEEMKDPDEDEKEAAEDVVEKGSEEVTKKGSEEVEKKASEEVEKKASEEVEIKASEDSGAAEGDNKHHKRGRSRAFSFTTAKAAVHDVSHFFNRSPKHHHEAETPRHREIEVALSEEKKDSEGDDVEKKASEEVEKKASEEVEKKASEEVEKKASEEVEKKASEEVEKRAPEEVEKKASKELEKKASAELEKKTSKEVEKSDSGDILDWERPVEKEHVKPSKRVSYEETIIGTSVTASTSEENGNPPIHRRPRPRNFSFLAWRDSEAGEEGNDAISPEELKKYNIGCSLARTFSIEAYLGEMAEGDAKDGGSGGEQSDSKDASSAVPDGLENSRRRRVILKSTPKEGGDPPPEPSEEAVGPDDRPAAYYGVQEAKELVTTTLHTAAYYGGVHQAKELVTSTINNAAYYGGVVHQDKAFMSTHCSTPSGQARYAIKIISPHIVERDFKKFLQAAMDMATETYFLSVLNHPHILKMRAVGQGDMFSPGYFLVLDRLYDTLSDRIEGRWQTQADHLENGVLVWSRAKKLRALWDERMGVMRDLASALHHLHELKIIYRDTKPENVGFDSNDVVKLFDFGLAKECREEDECANGTYKLTPCTGSIRYMAPENGNKWPYNFAADSYSFGILLWEVASLQRPFESYTPLEIRDMVMKWGERPKVNDMWPERVVKLMIRAWDSNFRKRPSMKEIEETLEKEIGDSPI